MNDEQDRATSFLTVLVPDQTAASHLTEASPENQYMDVFLSIPHLPISVNQLPLDKVKAEMGQVEQEIDQLLAGLKSTAGGYELSQVQVSVGISGQGSIGIVTAGMQASITLVYSAPNQPSQQ
jgi:hypothetical protein